MTGWKPTREDDRPEAGKGFFMDHSETTDRAIEGPVTLEDIARELGVSRATVSRALSDKGRISPELRQRIQKMAAAMGYRVNYAARALRSRQSHLVGVLIQEHSHYQMGEVLEGIQQEAQKHDYSVLIGMIQHNEAIEHQLLQSMTEKQVDGVILSTCGTPGALEYVRSIQAQGIRCINIFQDFTRQGLPSVTVDEVLGGFIATEHLIRLNHKRILFFGGRDPAGDYWAAGRYTGFCRAHDAHSLPLISEHRVGCGGFLEDGHRTMNRCLDLGIDFTAVFTICDLSAVGAIKAARERGLRVPEDLSVVGFDGSLMVRALFEPHLTTVVQSAETIGREAFRCLLGLAENSPEGYGPVVLSPTLDAGQTAAPAPERPGKLGVNEAPADAKDRPIESCPEEVRCERTR